MNNSDPIAVTCAEIEAALARGALWVKMTNNRWLVCRRNGVTKRWKTRPDDYSIPIKYGFRDCTRLTETDGIRSFPYYYIIANSDPNVTKR